MKETSEFLEQAEDAQKHFFSLPEDFRNQIINNAHEQANEIRGLVDTGKAKNYDEALAMLPSVFPEYQKMVINFETLDHGTVTVKAESNGDHYLYYGNNPPEFLGNVLDGVYSEVFGVLNIDVERQNENLKKIFDNLDLFRSACGNA
jgi:hypothetical protein